jgi:non-specific serine/threonine protein kinase
LQVVAMDRKRTHDLAEFILEDLALAFEMLRLVNAAIGRSALASGGAVLTVRRAIAMLGVEAVRSASQGLRRWPGPLDEPAAAELALLINRSKRAARLALLLRPAGYDAEVTYLVTLMHNLGRLVVQYHFADDAQQIRRLMQSGAPAREGEPEEPGMSEEAASHAVLGVDSEAIGLAVARQWGLDEGVLAMTRRLRLETPVRTPEGDAAMLRTVASCAHEALDASQLPAAKVTAALQRVVQRYSRILEFTLRDLQDAIKASAQPPAWGHTQPAPLERDSGRDSVVGAFASTGAQTRF